MSEFPNETNKTLQETAVSSQIVMQQGQKKKFKSYYYIFGEEVRESTEAEHVFLISDAKATFHLEKSFWPQTIVRRTSLWPYFFHIAKAVRVVEF